MRWVKWWFWAGKPEQENSAQTIVRVLGNLFRAFISLSVALPAVIVASIWAADILRQVEDAKLNDIEVLVQHRAGLREGPLCSPERPLVVSVANRTTQALQSMTIELGARKPGRSSDLTNYSNDRLAWDMIVLPGEWYMTCYSNELASRQPDLVWSGAPASYSVKLAEVAGWMKEEARSRPLDPERQLTLVQEQRLLRDQRRLVRAKARQRLKAAELLERQMPSFANEREELEYLRKLKRLGELEAKAAGETQAGETGGVYEIEGPDGSRFEVEADSPREAVATFKKFTADQDAGGAKAGPRDLFIDLPNRQPHDLLSDASPQMAESIGHTGTAPDGRSVVMTADGPKAFIRSGTDRATGGRVYQLADGELFRAPVEKPLAVSRQQRRLADAWEGHIPLDQLSQEERRILADEWEEVNGDALRLQASDADGDEAE